MFHRANDCSYSQKHQSPPHQPDRLQTSSTYQRYDFLRLHSLIIHVTGDDQWKVTKCALSSFVSWLPELHRITEIADQVSSASSPSYPYCVILFHSLHPTRHKRSRVDLEQPLFLLRQHPAAVLRRIVSNNGIQWISVLDSYNHQTASMKQRLNPRVD